MVTIEIDGIRGEGQTEREAKAALRKASRQHQEEQRRRTELQDAARNQANANAVLIYSRYFAKSRPLAWEIVEPGPKGCAERNDVTGEITLHTAHGAVRFPESFAVMKAIDTHRGIIAVAWMDHDADEMRFAAYGAVDAEHHMTDLPEDVGKWLVYGE